MSRFKSMILNRQRQELLKVLTESPAPQIRAAVLILILTLLPGLAQCSTCDEGAVHHSVDQITIYREPRSHHFVVGFITRDTGPASYFVPGKIKKANFHLVGCDVDSKTAHNLVDIPFHTLEYGAFGYEICGWAEESVYFSVRDDLTSGHSKPNADSANVYYRANWAGQSERVLQLPKDLESYSGQVLGYHVFPFEDKDPRYLTKGPSLRYTIEDYGDTVAIGVMTENDSNWRWLYQLRRSEGQVLLSPESAQP